MATIILRTAGAAIGSIFGPVGTAIGGALGAVAGYTLDQQLFGQKSEQEGPRLAGFQPQTAEEGVSLPQIFGTVRVGGTLIWMTRHEEARHTEERSGGKGSRRSSTTKTTTYSYYANFALAICEGEIAGIRRVWMDGREVDLTGIEMRVYRGTDDQAPDPLIEAKQGSGQTPAYRGTAYAVFERMPLKDYGNRLPQVHFEVMRPVGGIAEDIRAVCLIPGSTGFGLFPTRLVSNSGPGREKWVNRHVLFGESDLAASIDELMALCPHLRHIALVVSWFGDDLRAGNCAIRPGVTSPSIGAKKLVWSVDGLTPAAAHRISTLDGGPAFGSTPADISVIEAIRSLKARGLSVTLYPFVMMDIPAGNTLDDLDGEDRQPAYPWRGRIAPIGSAESTDAQIAAFLGNGASFGYRRFILHYADIARIAGGVDAFLIGSELRGLTTARNDSGEFPFVQGLCDLAADVRQALGAGTKLTYGADWSEWFGFHPKDDSGDVYFHLDPLWADPNIDAIGIDNYLPLSDWRPDDIYGGNPDCAASPYDADALQTAIDGGEYGTWHYASEEDRDGRIRTPIEDGAYAKNWVFQPKALRDWWSNQHFERRSGIELAEPTEWTPMAKPVWFTELGAPAIDGGATQPNLFVDGKSSESAAPADSNGGRDDLIQRRFLKAHLTHWKDEAGSPVDWERLYLWAWDTRPFPAFPLLDNIWSDGDAWSRGHWLNGRLDQIEIGDFLADLLTRAGIKDFDTSGVDAMVEGIIVDAGVSTRQFITPILDLHDIETVEKDGRLTFRSRARQGSISTIIDAVEQPDNGPATETYASPIETHGEILAAARDPFMEYQSAVARQFENGADQKRSRQIAFPGAMHRGALDARIADRLRRSQEERVSLALSLPPSLAVPQPASRFRLEDRPDVVWKVEEVETGLDIRIRARRDEAFAPHPDRSLFSEGLTAQSVAEQGGAPAVAFLDLPLIDGDDAADRFRIAAWSRFWKPFAALAAPGGVFEQRALIDEPAIIGETVDDLPPARPGRVSAATLHVQLFSGSLASVERSALLAGANAAAIQGPSGWEVLQFEHAEEVATDLWRLSGLLRGQLGTDDIAAGRLPIGSTFVLLDSAVEAAGIRRSEMGTEMAWRIEPAGRESIETERVEALETGGLRALMPLAPVHPTARTVDDAVDFRWIRRGRIDADRWEGLDIPLGEEGENYEATLRGPAGETLISEILETTNWTVPQSAFAAQNDVHSLEVRQLSQTVGAGIAMVRDFVPADISPTQQRIL
ncbi:glycoside hydrolase/phage tail family protein [Notoacmeibacter sp. MSK16QG-6]|uniref:baseplate multidomain protein megatron n=1 Tax=Notoacmeibacter sp. MSK16QG-6 TaxID=2957982 RepID=UPI0020A0A456|nr:glycoside hydrolase/phage tail family protein [Notoacmeibacter sp. MSK16QG-6]MCP1198124.1 glycoside hydrolase/phage tail family protein [Notoacmeibacter sp. MSK16QG-6]